MQGHEVVFARLDLADIRGIWRHAGGRVVGLRRQGCAAASVDVKFAGYDILECGRRDLVRRRHRTASGRFRLPAEGPGKGPADDTPSCGTLSAETTGSVFFSDTFPVLPPGAAAITKI